MRILFLIDSLRSGGKERRLVALLKGLKDYPDIQCEIAVMSENVHFKEVFDQGVKVHYLIRKWSKDPGILLKLNKLCKTYRPNILHTWGYLAAIYALPIVIWRNIKFVNGYITYAYPIKSFSKLWYGSILTFPFSKVVLANSKAGLKAHNLEPSDKNICITNGFDFSRLDNIIDEDLIKKQFGIKTKYVVGMIANFREAKDYPTYLQAAQKLLNKRKDVTFLCVGHGEYLEESKKLVSEKFSDHIKFLGEQGSIESIANILDVGVLACNIRGHGEGMSNSIMEYMALGKPAVVSESGGNQELVDHGKTGFIVQPFDAEEMALRIEELLDNEEKKKEMGQAGRARIEKEFSMKKVTAAYVTMYKNLLA
jgi:glycosyltransferase involved in cell wall biosynthesis